MSEPMTLEQQFQKRIQEVAEELGDLRWYGVYEALTELAELANELGDIEGRL